MKDQDRREERVEEVEEIELGSVSEETQGGFIYDWEVSRPLF